jgi:two-component system, NarL family, nitrate/nitrite response regulator NarL
MNLTPREWDVLVGIAEGLTDDQIGARLYIARDTVRLHGRVLRAKLNARNRAHAVSIAYQRRLLVTSFTEEVA